jgi:hypothetical protein
MAAWVIPVVMAIAGAMAKGSEANAANKEKTSTWNQTTVRGMPDFTNWAYTPEQNEQNMGNVFYGQIMSIAQNLMRSDLGSFLNDFGMGSGGGGMGTSGRKQYRSGPTERQGTNRG